MFFNRVHFTSKKTFRLIKIKCKQNRTLMTFHDPNGGKGGPNFDYVVTAFLISFGFYWLNRK